MERRPEFIAALQKEFPAALENPRRDLDGLIHLEVAEFRDTVEDAVRDGRFWYVEQAFRFVEGYLDDSDDDVDNALGVSFLEDFAYTTFSKNEIESILCRLSMNMRKQLARFGEQWNVRVRPAT